MNIHEQLIRHMEKFTSITKSDIPRIEKHFQSMKFGKKEFLMKAGQRCKHHYYVGTGCVRMFYMTEKGVEYTTQFALENWWLTDHSKYPQQGISEFFIQAIEQTEVLAIDAATEISLFQEVPQTEKYFRTLYQKAYGAAQLRQLYRSEASTEELYLDFNSKYPDFVKRVPQYMLASFLGMTPEYLSEIKKRRS